MIFLMRNQSLKHPMFKSFEKTFKEFFLDDKKIMQKKNIFDVLLGFKKILLEHFSKIQDEVYKFFIEFYC